MWKLQYLSKDERLMLIIFLIDANQIAGGALLSTQEVCKEFRYSLFKPSSVCVWEGRPLLLFLSLGWWGL